MSTGPDDRDERLDQLVEHVVTLASGQLEQRLAPSSASDDIDAVIVGVNMLAEELHALTVDLEGRVEQRTRQLKEAQHQLERLALYDPLTGLANRTLLGMRIDDALAMVDGGHPAPAMLVLDLDGFKAVNDSFGHAVGDLLLVEVARRLTQVLRDTDTVARLGGDEFAVVVDTAGWALADAGRGPAMEIATRILDALRTPILAGGHTCWVGASIGIRYARHGDDAGTLLRDADTAMYAAKSQSRGYAQVYEPAMHAAAVSRVRLADELRAALPAGQLVVHYQPVVELATGRTAGVEALVRWHHPTRGMLGPGSFVPIAEDTNLIVELDHWVLDTAVAEVARWRTTVLGRAPFALHVNVSPVEIRAQGFAGTVVDCLARHGLRAADLLLEITETRMIGEDTLTMAAMQALEAAGIGVAIDDFGTGCSSLGYVRRRFVDVIKIDRSLITGLDTDRSQHRIAAAILAVVDAFGLAAVAEGVETAAQAAELRRMGCRYGQGYHLGRPMPAEAMTRLLAGAGRRPVVR